MRARFSAGLNGWVWLVFAISGAWLSFAALAIAGSTLAVAACSSGPHAIASKTSSSAASFESKYDAIVILDSFSARLRDQIDLDSLSAELLDVTSRTMKPVHASLWLRGVETHEGSA